MTICLIFTYQNQLCKYLLLYYKSKNMDRENQTEFQQENEQIKQKLSRDEDEKYQCSPQQRFESMESGAIDNQGFNASEIQEIKWENRKLVEGEKLSQEEQISKIENIDDNVQGKNQQKEEDQNNKNELKQQPTNEEISEPLTSDYFTLESHPRQKPKQEQSPLQSYQQAFQTQFIQAYNNLIFDKEIEYSIKLYFQFLVKYSHQDIFYQHFVENQYLAVLMTKMRQMKYSTEIVKGTFWGLEYLLRGLGDERKAKKGSTLEMEKQASIREQQFIYLLIMLNKHGYITEDYKFSETQDCAYFANFLKLLIRKIMGHLQQKQKLKVEDNKYLAIFFNPSQPTFPLLLKLLQLHNFKDPIIQTSIRLCLLEFIRGANHPSYSSLPQNRRLNCYLDNFPFVIMYAMYGLKIFLNVKKILEETCCKYLPFSNRLCDEQDMLYEDLLADLIFLEDFSLTESQSINHRIQLFCNVYFFYIGRTLFQFLHKILTNQLETPAEIPLKDVFINCLMVIRKIMAINSVMKIKLGYRQMLRKFINCNFWQYLTSKKSVAMTLDWRYWGNIGVGMGLGVQEYCKAVFFDNFELEMQKSATFKVTESISKTEDMQMESKSFEYTSYPLEVEEEDKTEKFVAQSQVISLPKQQLSASRKKVAPQSTFIDIMHSYIPKSWLNWYRSQMRKLSTILGFKITTTSFHQINYYNLTNQYSKQSFSTIIDNIQQLTYNQKSNFEELIKKTKKSFFSRYNSIIKENNIFNMMINSPLLEKDREEIIYYYLGVVIELIEGKKNKEEYDSDIALGEYKFGEQEKEKAESSKSIHIYTEKNNDCCYWSCVEEIIDFVTVAYKCNSLMLVGAVYWYVKLIDFQLNSLRTEEESPLITEQNRQLLAMYTKTMAKLTYYILTEGWGTFLGKFNIIKQTIWNKDTTCHKNHFNNDIFRDIECDILFFLTLRHIFGTKNSTELDNISQYITETDFITKQLKIPCKLHTQKNPDDRKYMIIDGQYIKFITNDDVLINKEPFSVNKCHLYIEGIEKVEKSSKKSKIGGNEEYYMIEVIDKVMGGNSYTVSFEEKALKDYVIKEIKHRKNIQMEVELGLRTLRFDIQ